MARTLKKRFTVPIFNACFWVIICDEIGPERQKMQAEFGECPVGDYTALCSYLDGEVAIFLSRRCILPSIIAHEIFHATHRILEWRECNFDAEHHEQGAMLCEYLSELVAKTIAADRKRLHIHA